MPKFPSFFVWLFFLVAVAGALLWWGLAGRGGMGSKGASAPEAWEYKTLAVDAASHERTGPNALASNEILPDEQTLNRLGGEGWSLATSYLEMETAFPNLSNPKYVTGLQPNVRPKRVVFVFARPKR